MYVNKNKLLTKSSRRWSLPAMTITWHQCDDKMVVLYKRSHVLSLVAIYARFCITLKLFLNNTITSCYRQCSHYGAGNAILQAMQYKDFFSALASLKVMRVELLYVVKWPHLRILFEIRAWNRISKWWRYPQHTICLHINHTAQT